MITVPSTCHTKAHPGDAGRRHPLARPQVNHEWVETCSYLMMRPPSAHSTWPVIAAAASEAR